MNKEDFSYDEAKKMVREMKDQIQNGSMPEDILYEYRQKNIQNRIWLH
jgi:hypothetical protein